MQKPINPKPPSPLKPKPAPKPEPKPEPKPVDTHVGGYKHGRCGE